jgi:hypothetical protein
VLLTILILVAMERLLRSEASAKLKAEQLRLTLEHMSQGIMLVTKDLQVPIINGRCGELLGLPAVRCGIRPSRIARRSRPSGSVRDHYQYARSFDL